jgi:hypothetical protein
MPTPIFIGTPSFTCLVVQAMCYYLQSYGIWSLLRWWSSRAWGPCWPPLGRWSRPTACLKEVWDLMVRFSEENSGTQVYFLRHCNIFYLLIPPSFAIIVFIRTTYSTIVYTIYMVLCILIFLYFVDFSFTLYLSNSFLFFLYFFNFSLYLYREDI